MSSLSVLGLMCVLFGLGGIFGEVRITSQKRIYGWHATLFGYFYVSVGLFFIYQSYTAETINISYIMIIFTISILILFLCPPYGTVNRRQKLKDEKLRQKVLGYVDLLFDENDETRERAKKNLIRIGKKHRTSSIVTRNLTSALESDNWQAQQAAIEILVYFLCPFT